MNACKKKTRNGKGMLWEYLKVSKIKITKVTVNYGSLKLRLQKTQVLAPLFIYWVT
jgi:hypothetical protein